MSHQHIGQLLFVDEEEILKYKAASYSETTISIICVIIGLS